MTDDKQLKIKWRTKICAALIGRKIVNVRYMDYYEMKEFGFYKNPVVITFDDGHFMIPFADDEGNDGGSIFTNFPDLEMIPTI